MNHDLNPLNDISDTLKLYLQIEVYFKYVMYACWQPQKPKLKLNLVGKYDMPISVFINVPSSLSSAISYSLVNNRAIFVLNIKKPLLLPASGLLSDKPSGKPKPIITKIDHSL